MMTYKERYEKEGYDVITPYDANPDQDKPYSCLMGKDIEMILECDAAFFAPGFHHSRRCQLEFAAAKIYGKEIIK